MTIEWRGGLCPDGLCERTLEIARDGSVHDPRKPGGRLGAVPSATVQRLGAEISRADFHRIASHPFAGTCPMAYDGQEAVYTFDAPSGLVVIASCSVAIDPTDPLFRAVDAAVAAIR